MKKDWKIAIVVAVILFGVAGFLLYETTKTEVETKAKVDKLEGDKFVKIEQTLRAKFAQDEALTSGMEILTMKADKYRYQVRISLKFTPASIEEVSAITQGICEVVFYELKKAGIERSISVWAQKPKSPDLVIVYGRTEYSSATGRFEFKKMK